MLKLARKCGLRPRRTYSNLAKGLLGKVHRLGRERQFKLMSGAQEEQRRFTELVAADIRRQLALVRCPGILERLERELALAERLVKQRRDDSDKLYSLHEPYVDCISKGKTRMPFEFGVKSSLAVTHKECFVVVAMTFPGAPYDGHTLAEAVGQAEEMTGVRPLHIFADRGYRSHGVEGPKVFISGQRKGVTPALRRDIRRRAAIEPVIGHMKSDGRLARCSLKGTEGDMFHAIMCGCGHKIRMILRWIENALERTKGGRRKRLGMRTAPLPSDLRRNSRSPPQKPTPPRTASHARTPLKTPCSRDPCPSGRRWTPFHSGK